MADESDDGFIGLPPGMAPPAIDADSGTVRRDRPERQRTAEREEIVFFPVVPGVPAAPVVEPRPTEPFDRADLDEATRASLPRRRAAAAWQLVLAGRAIPVEGLLYLGRNPVASAAHPGAALLSVEDPAKSVSKTHAMLEVDAAGLWVHDLDSTNGVWVIPDGGEPVEVVPGRRAALPAGCTLELGELAIAVEHT